MADDKRALVPPQPTHLPTRSAPSVPALPSSSGQLAWTRKSLAEKDAAYTRARADWLRAQTEHYQAAKELSDARFAFAVGLSKWHSLNEVCEHEDRKGYLTRISELKVLALELETKEITARIARDAAILALSAYQPQPPPPSAPAPAPVGLTPDEVDELLSNFPDLTAETRHLVALALKGRLNEKTKG
jgi:hypothetical protein